MVLLASALRLNKLEILEIFLVVKFGKMSMEPPNFLKWNGRFGKLLTRILAIQNNFFWITKIVEGLYEEFFFMLVLLRRTSLLDHLLWSTFQSKGFYRLQFCFNGPLRAASMHCFNTFLSSLTFLWALLLAVLLKELFCGFFRV